MAERPPLAAEAIRVSFAKSDVLTDLSVEIAPATLTVIVGPNGSGKSTLLRALARLQPVQAGRVLLGGERIDRQNTRAVARSLAVLPQGLAAPEGISVRDLVARGRMPHQTPLQQWSAKDAEVVEEVLRRTRLDGLADRKLTALSGGQQQRVWIAMVLAQDTSLLLLDEPTTYLDMPHQIELLDLVKSMVGGGKTVVTVLHDINLAARFADRMIAVKTGRIFCDGPPAEVVRADVIEAVFGLACTVIEDPVHGKPFVIPA